MGPGIAGHKIGQWEKREVWVLVREVWVLGQLPEKFTPPACTHPTGGFQQLLLEPVLKFHYMRKKLELHKEEYVLMQVISLFSPGDNPTCPTWLPRAPRPPLQACSHPISFS